MPVSNRGLVSLQELKDALARNHYRREDTARELNVTRKTLYRWMKKYDL
jgi:transcriptional regulator with PAS, ATPase and Fis domain